MTNMRRRHSPKIKTQVALEAIKEKMTQAEITSKYGVHSSLVNKWKRDAIKGLLGIFQDKRDREQLKQEKLIDYLYEQIGRHQVELAWLKKKSEGYLS